METKLKDVKSEPKFKINDTVTVDTIYGKFRYQVTDLYWEDETYLSKNGSWVYRLVFLTKKGKPDRRRNYRQFEEVRLSLAKESNQAIKKS